MTKSNERTRVSFKLKFLERQVITADSEEEYELKREQLLSQIPKEIEVTESKLQVGIFVLTEVTPIS